MTTPFSASDNAPGASASRWAALGESSSTGGPFNRGGNRGRGNSRGGRGGGGRGGGRAGGNAREPKNENAKPQPSQEKSKPPLAKVSTTATSQSNPSEGTSTTPRSKNPSRRPSRSNPASTTTTTAPAQAQSPELPRPNSRTSNSSSTTSNRRKRSTASKAPSLPQIKSPAADDNLLRPGRPVLPSVPRTAPPPTRDVPPHLSGQQQSPVEMRTNIDALVERVRAVAMAENRPSTPGAAHHIDWAGDDDDSLPDLDDWGITSINAAQTISPIIVDGLKPLPEPLFKPLSSQGNIATVVPSPPITPTLSNQQEIPKHAVAAVAPGGTDTASKGGRGRDTLHPSLPTRPTSRTSRVPEANRSPAATQMRSALNPSKGEPVNAPSGDHAQHDPVPNSKVVDEPGLTVVIVDEAIESASSASQSSSQYKPHDVKPSPSRREGGLAASIHAPKPSDVASAPANVPAFDQPSRSPNYREPHHTHTRRPASFNAHPPRHPRANNTSGQRGHGQHARNHSSPHTASVDGSHNKLPHARPVITGDAISRLARTIVSGTPKSAPVVSTSTT